MPDIFGQEPEDYAVVRHLRSLPNEEYGNEWERHVAAHSQRFPAFNPGHNFRAMGSGRNDADLAMYGQLGAMLPESHTRATEDAQAVGFLTNNLLAIQTQVDEIMYTSATACQCSSALTTAWRRAPKRGAFVCVTGPGVPGG